MGWVDRVGDRRAVAGGMVVAMLIALTVLTPFAAPVRANHPANTCLDVEPETASNPTWTQHTVTATLRAVDPGDPAQLPDTCEGSPTPPTTDVTIIFEIIDGDNDPDHAGDNTSGPDLQGCTISANPPATSCNTFYRATDPGTDTIRGHIAGHDPDTQETTTDDSDQFPPAAPDATDVVEKEWDGPQVVLDCLPETDTNTTGTDHAITCEVTRGQTVLAGVPVDMEITGVNNPDGNDLQTNPDLSCTTGVDGKCVFTHGPGGTGTTSTSGVTTYKAWVDADGQDSISEADDSETKSTDGANSDPDATDVVDKNWKGAPAQILMSPDADGAPVGACNVYTITARDGAGALAEGATIDLEQVHELATNQTANDEPTVSFCTPTLSDGPNPSGVDTSKGDLHSGVESPDNLGTLGGETLAATDNLGRITIGIQVTPGNGSAGTGQVILTAFYEGVDDDDPGANDPKDTSTKTWTPGGVNAVSSLDCNPETDSNPDGTSHLFTCLATDTNQQPVPGVNVFFDVISGPNAEEVAVDTQCRAPTDQQGVATCEYADNQAGAGASAPGLDTIAAYVNQGPPQGTGPGPQPNEPQDEITKTWTEPPSGLIIDLTCDDSNGSSGDATADDDRSSEDTIDCRDPLESQTETFTAFVTDSKGTTTTTDDTPASGIEVRFRQANESDCAGCGNNNPNDAGFVLGQTTTAGPVSCTTDTSGRCSVDVTNQSPGEGDQYDVRAEVLGQTIPGAGEPDSSDVASKEWATFEVVNLVLTPEQASNETRTGHTVTATVSNQNGAPVQGVNVDFSVAGRNPMTVNDRLTDSQGQVHLFYVDGGPDDEPGTDTISAWADISAENDVPDSGEPTDTSTKDWLPSECGQPNVFCGTQGDDQITGSEGDDVIICGAGDDTVDALGGDDIVNCGDGNDDVDGGDGNDNIDGGDGDDVCSGGDGKDVIDCGAGNDVIKGGSQGDVLSSSSGRDKISGGSGKDSIKGGSGADTLRGGGGNDTVRGQGGNDLITGGGGNDTLRGNAGDDTLKGGRGDDSLNGGSGDNRCRTGPGRKDRVRNC